MCFQANNQSLCMPSFAPVVVCLFTPAYSLQNETSRLISGGSREPISTFSTFPDLFLRGTISSKEIVWTESANFISVSACLLSPLRGRNVLFNKSIPRIEVAWSRLFLCSGKGRNNISYTTALRAPRWKTPGPTCCIAGECIIVASTICNLINVTRRIEFEVDICSEHTRLSYGLIARTKFRMDVDCGAPQINYRSFPKYETILSVISLYLGTVHKLPSFLLRSTPLCSLLQESKTVFLLQVSIWAWIICFGVCASASIAPPNHRHEYARNPWKCFVSDCHDQEQNLCKRLYWGWVMTTRFM